MARKQEDSSNLGGDALSDKEIIAGELVSSPEQQFLKYNLKIGTRISRSDYPDIT